MDMENMEILDSNETGTLYRIKNDLFDSVAFEAPDGERKTGSCKEPVRVKGAGRK